MTDFPAAAYFTGSHTQGEGRAAWDAWLAATKQLPGGLAEEALTIASGSITPTRSGMVVDTEAAAASDDLLHIVQTNLPDGSLIMLRSTASGRVVVLKNAAGGAGQLSLLGGVDLALTDPTRVALLRREGTTWRELLRSVIVSDIPPATPYIDPRLLAYDFDDFFTLRDGYMPSTSSTIAAALKSAALGGVLQVVGDGTTLCSFALSDVEGAIRTFAATSKLFSLAMRIAQAGTAAGTRRIGLATVPVLSTEGTGIYFRFAVNAHLIAVARTGANEVTVDTTITMADGVFHDVKLVATAAQTIQVYADGVLKGTLSGSFVPTASLGLIGYGGTITAGAGFLLDYWQYVGNR